MYNQTNPIRIVALFNCGKIVDTVFTCCSHYVNIDGTITDNTMSYTPFIILLLDHPTLYDAIECCFSIMLVIIFMT